MRSSEGKSLDKIMTPIKNPCSSIRTEVYDIYCILSSTCLRFREHKNISKTFLDENIVYFYEKKKEMYTHKN